MKIGHFWAVFAPPPRPQGYKRPYVPLVPKMLHAKFEKNWTGGYQEEVKNVQLLTHFINDHFGPHPNTKTPTPRITKFKIIIEISLLIPNIHLVLIYYQ